MTLTKQPDPDCNIKLLHSNADLADTPSWQESKDIIYFTRENEVTLYLTHFCSYCLIQEKFIAEGELKQTIVSVFVRTKLLQDKEIVHVKVLFSSKADGSNLLCNKWEMLTQQQFPLINKRPVRVLLSPKKNMWKEYNNELKQGLLYTEFDGMGTFPPRVHFHLIPTAEEVTILDFNVTIKQCCGVESTLRIIEGLSDYVSKHENKAEIDTAVEQDILDREQNRYALETSSVEERKTQTRQLMLSKGLPQAALNDRECDGRDASLSSEHCDSQTEELQSILNPQQSDVQAEGPHDALDSPKCGSQTNKPQDALDIPQCSGQTDKAQGTSNAEHCVDQTEEPLAPRYNQLLVQNSQANVNVYNNCTFANLPNEMEYQLLSIPSTQMPVPYDKVRKIASYMQISDRWKMLASKLNMDNDINNIEAEASMSRKMFAEILIQRWLRVNGRDATYDSLLNSLRKLQYNDLVHDLEDMDRRTSPQTIDSEN